MKTIPPKLQIWIDTRKKFRLSHAQIQMARELWDEALKTNDKLLRLYTLDAIVEDPLIPHLLNQESDI